MKVIINRDFGGFGLSDKAFEKLLERKGVAFESVRSDKYDMVHYYAQGHADDEEHYLSPYDYYHDRADADLIAIVEEMGEEANGNYASLDIIEIPDGVDWQVEEYDGSEWIAEKHRTWR